MRYPHPDQLSGEVDAQSPDNILLWLAACGAHRVNVPEEVLLAAAGLVLGGPATLPVSPPHDRSDASGAFIAWLLDIERHSLAVRACRGEERLAGLARRLDLDVGAACVALGCSRPPVDDAARGASMASGMALLLSLLSSQEKAPPHAAHIELVRPAEVQDAGAGAFDMAPDTVLGVQFARMTVDARVIALDCALVLAGPSGVEHDGCFLYGPIGHWNIVVARDGEPAASVVIDNGELRVAPSPTAEVAAGSALKAQAGNLSEELPWRLLPDAGPDALLADWLAGELSDHSALRLQAALAIDPAFRASYKEHLLKRLARLEVTAPNPAWSPLPDPQRPLRSILMPHLGRDAAFTLRRVDGGFEAVIPSGDGSPRRETWATGSHEWHDPMLGDVSVELRDTTDPVFDLQRAAHVLAQLAEEDSDPHGTDRVIDAVLASLETLVEGLEAAASRAPDSAPTEAAGRSPKELADCSAVALSIRVSLQRIADAREDDIDLLLKYAVLDERLERTGPALAWLPDSLWRSLTRGLVLDADAWWGWGTEARASKG